MMVMISSTIIGQTYFQGEIRKPIVIESPDKFLEIYQLIKTNSRDVSFYEHKKEQTYAVAVGNVLLAEDLKSYSDSDASPAVEVVHKDKGIDRLLLYYENKYNDYTKKFRNDYGQEYFLPKEVTPLSGASLRTTKFRKITDEEIARCENMSFNKHYANDYGIGVYFDNKLRRYLITYGDDVLVQDVTGLGDFQKGEFFKVSRKNIFGTYTLLSWKRGNIVLHDGENGEKETILPKLSKDLAKKIERGRKIKLFANEPDVSPTLDYDDFLKYDVEDMGISHIKTHTDITAKYPNKYGIKVYKNNNVFGISYTIVHKGRIIVWATPTKIVEFVPGKHILVENGRGEQWSVIFWNKKGEMIAVPEIDKSKDRLLMAVK